MKKIMFPIIITKLTYMNILISTDINYFLPISINFNDLLNNSPTQLVEDKGRDTQWLHEQETSPAGVP